MTGGKAPETWLDTRGPGPIYVDLVEFHSRGRLQVRQPGRDCVEWLREKKSVTAALELAEQGQIVFRAWSTFGKVILDYRHDLLSKQNEKDAETALLALEERFLRVTLDKDARFSLHGRVRDHLGISLDHPVHLYLICFPHRFEIWTQEFRNQERKRLLAYLDPLPLV